MKLITRTGLLLAATALGCGATLPGTALATTAAPAHSVPHTTPRGCETPGLVVWLDTNGNGAAGSVYYNLEFTNLSGHACSLNGFPFIHAVSLTGSLLGRRASFTSATPHAVTLKEGQTAKAVLRIVDVDNFSASQCKPVTAAGLQVYPPNQTTAAPTIPYPFGACSAVAGPVYMQVAPVAK